MNDKQIKLIIGSLLHDIGKAVYRSGDGRNHSLSGYDFLKERKPDFDKEILDCVRYHHAANIKNSGISNDSLAYITYFADNVAAAADRRDGDTGEEGFDKSVPLSSVFNILNGNKGNMHYTRSVLDPDKDINYPTDTPIEMDKGFYETVIRNIADNLQGIEVSKDYINSLLAVMEANLMYIPSSTSKRELADISLYDHVKITAAIAECIYRYFQDNDIGNYKQKLFGEYAEKTWKEKMFMLYSIDLSGIQRFIYTISSKGALKGLRARSFYLELIMEHIIDELLDALELSRACLIYAGGGHCYMLLPNTQSVKSVISAKADETNQWFADHFGTDLYMADGYAECSATELKNEPDGSYSELYVGISKTISLKKSHRYSADEIRMLNRNGKSGERECRICRRTGPTDEEDRCPLCAGLERLSSDVLGSDYFAVMHGTADDSLPLPGGKQLIAADNKRLRSLMSAENYVRSYTKNRPYTGRQVATKLWVGDYNIKGADFGELAEKSQGIKRIAVLRADIDNLGNTFVNGFKQQGGRYETLSRTAALSRQLSLFFKCYINKVLQYGVSNDFTHAGERQLDIVYSGGDDAFLVGAWNDVMDAFVDIRNAFTRFTQGTLTISGGIGIFGSKHPINRMATETAELEDYAKGAEGKDAICLFDETGRYKWQTYIQDVLGDKFKTVSTYLSGTDERGKAFLYKLLEMLREIESNDASTQSGKQESRVKFNRARFVYYLSRLEPRYSEDDKGASYDAYRAFASKMYQWSMNAEDRRQVVTAIYLYVYLTRERGGNTDADK